MGRRRLLIIGGAALASAPLMLIFLARPSKPFVPEATDPRLVGWWIAREDPSVGYQFVAGGQGFKKEHSQEPHLKFGWGTEGNFLYTLWIPVDGPQPYHVSKYRIERNRLLLEGDVPSRFRDRVLVRGKPEP